MLEVVEATCVPNETPVVGALIERVPDVNVKDAGVEAAAGNTAPMARATAVARSTTNFRTTMTPHSCHSRTPPEGEPCIAIAAFEFELNSINMRIIHAIV